MAEAWHVCQPGGDFRTSPSLEARILELAGKQHWVVTTEQLRVLGLGRSGVAKRVAAGRLHRVHRGVYAVGRPVLGAKGRWTAAVMAYGPAAALSQRPAAALQGLLSGGGQPHVTVPSSGARGRPGIHVHRSATLTAADLTVSEGIRCTSVARTLVDLGDTEPRRVVEQAVNQAEVLRVFDLVALEEVLARVGPRKGAGVLRSVLAELEGPTLTDRELEERFLALCRGVGIPQPEVNAWLLVDEGASIKADFLWRQRRLIVETDGRETHGTRRAFETDRLRDQRAKLAGWDVVRFTWRQVTREPARVARTVAALLAR